MAPPKDDITFDSSLTNLADARIGAKVMFATDEWFSPSPNLLKAEPPAFDPDAFCAQGKVMDGWESRRRRTPGYDWCILKLGLAGQVRGIELDTAWFTGNQVPAASVYGACIDGDDSWMPPLASLGTQGTAATPEAIAEAEAACLAKATWVELVPMSPLRPGYTENGNSVHRFLVTHPGRVTHLRLNDHPDGGIARLKAWGDVACDFDRQLRGKAGLNLASVELGASALGCSNKHYGEPSNLLRPGRGVNMGDGWETARNPTRTAVIKRDPATGLVDMPGVRDWCVLRLGAVSDIDSVIVDTCHFKGNYPESILVEACCAPADNAAAVLGRGEAEWTDLVPRVRLGPDAEHSFTLAKGELAACGSVTHVRVSIYPDGGIMRFRAFGTAVSAFPSAAESGGAGDGGVAGWTAKQGRILTGGGAAEALYTPERGFPFRSTELPHHHKTAGTTHEAFAAFKGDASPVVCGAWERPLFLGGWEHSTGLDEAVFNVQTPSLFVDLRIPRLRPALEAGTTSFAGVKSDDLLRLFARQHAFSGCATFDVDGAGAPVCTRHHCIDWNFAGVPRSRPNKWRVETKDASGDEWKEWSFAKDDFGQCYYMERWQRHEGGSAADGPVLAMRTAKGSARDEVLVAVGTHFCYARDRVLPAGTAPQPSLVAAVDGALKAGNRPLAEAWLSLEAGHGTVGDWTIDASLQPWRQGTKLFKAGDIVVGVNADGSLGKVVWGESEWDVLEWAGSAADLASMLC